MNILEEGRWLNTDGGVLWIMIIVVGQIHLCCNHKINNLYNSFTYGCLLEEFHLCDSQPLEMLFIIYTKFEVLRFFPPTSHGNQ